MTGRVRSPCTSILELEYAFVDAGGQLPCGGVEEEARPSAYGSQCTFADAPSPRTRSCRRSPCAVRLAQLTCGLHPSSHHMVRLEVMLRSTEASSKASRAIGTGSPLGCLALQSAPVYSRVSSTASCCGRRLAGGPGHRSPVWAGSVHFCQPDTPRIPTCLSRDSYGPRVGPSGQAGRVIGAITSFKLFVALEAP
ncbi:hypothetical protein GL50803_0027657 [Giardia duodenalis]|uniref:Uncharacterized protein n=1 Tax=Giardia intestinalis (strain ATCC 50803 / WB clone C6) TaxID=184922 RepID=D3KGG1_GIAIC|nr:hypothetical protein GL50803_0027657 [Giardia intestinalis]KAE8301811.1 hypothetical protein GL50803_0027657 [Giardia intestinalis]